MDKTLRENFNAFRHRQIALSCRDDFIRIFINDTVINKITEVILPFKWAEFDVICQTKKRSRRENVDYESP